MFYFFEIIKYKTTRTIFKVDTRYTTIYQINLALYNILFIIVL